MKAKNIKWDTDGDHEVFDSLPQEVEIPSRFSEKNYMEGGEFDENLGRAFS